MTTSDSETSSAYHGQRAVPGYFQECLLRESLLYFLWSNKSSGEPADESNRQQTRIGILTTGDGGEEKDEEKKIRDRVFVVVARAVRWDGGGFAK